MVFLVIVVDEFGDEEDDALRFLHLGGGHSNIMKSMIPTNDY